MHTSLKRTLLAGVTSGPLVASLTGTAGAWGDRDGDGSRGRDGGGRASSYINPDTGAAPPTPMSIRVRTASLADIEAWAAAWNDNPTPFVWHKTADEILESLAGYCTNVNQGATP